MAFNHSLNVDSTSKLQNAVGKDGDAIAELFVWDSSPITIWLFNIAMENGPFIDGLPMKHGNFPWLC